MSDQKLRELERAVTSGDASAKTRLVRERVRNGETLTEARRSIYGMAPGDIYGWQHPETQTTHAYRVTYPWRSVCGQDVRRTSTYTRAGFLQHYVLEAWWPLSGITCKQCLKGKWLQAHSLVPGTQRGGFIVPEWETMS